MQANPAVGRIPSTVLTPAWNYLRQPARRLASFDRANFRPDLIAGVTVAVIVLPQAIAFALIAELPPAAGLYASIIGGIAAALWGSSDHLYSGPTNALSILVLSTLIPFAAPGGAQYVVAAGLLAVMVGVLQLLMGLLRLGVLVNFVSHSVIVGFASGAGVLIAIKQLGPLLGLRLSGGNIVEVLSTATGKLTQIHWPTAAIGLGTIASILIIRRINRRLPAEFITIAIASFVVALLHLNEEGVVVIGKLPSTLPPLADLPLFDIGMIADLSTGALAVAAIGLVQTTAIARSLAAHTNQRLDNNQEFVGQGFANILAGFFSGYPCCASFSISAVNFRAGARTSMAVILSCLFVLIGMLTLGPLTAYLPTAALAGVLILVSYDMVNRAEMKRIWQGARGDAMIMVVTFLGTLFLRIEFAVLFGILLSFALYIFRTSAPRVQAVIPDEDFRHFIYRAGAEECPQLGIIEIQGDLYFGAVSHIEETILAHAEKRPEQIYLLVRMHQVNQIDFSGIHMLENVIRAYREKGGDVFFVRVNHRVRRLIHSTGCELYVGVDHFLDEDQAINFLFHRVLDPAICIYECPIRVFRECQNLPKRTDLIDVPALSSQHRSRGGLTVIDITAAELWGRLHDHNGRAPFVIDVREPREYKRGHIIEATSVPLATILNNGVELPSDREIVFVCRSGRRSRRAAFALHQKGVKQMAVLSGGMQAWEAAGLLEAVDEPSH
jgi:SulP family sulfate permease